MLRNMKTYSQLTAVQDKGIDIFGEPCTIFRPAGIDVVEGSVPMSGYETAHDYEQWPSKVSIDFKVKRRWFYHFNWFPEDEDRIVMAYFPLSEKLSGDCFIRTKTIEHVSPYGDLLFRIVKIADDGRFFTLRRIAFLTYVSDKTMFDVLEVKA